MSRAFSTRARLVAQATEATGLTDFGEDASWEEPLDRLLDALATQQFLPGGVERIENRLGAVLRARLQVEDWLARHPDAASGAVEGPVIIVGLPRTATTALLNLLANDDRWRYVRAWEAEQPIPPPDRATEAEDERALAERARIAADTTFAGMHIHQAGGPVDDGALLRLGGRNQELGLPALAYTRWWRDCDMAATYRSHHRSLRLLQHRRPPTRWLLKAPWHNFHLDELVAEYPNARFVMTHRDPVRLVPSVCSLVHTAFATYQPADAIDRVALGRFMLEHLQISMSRMMDFRRRHGDDRFVDVFHAPFNEGPVREVARIYESLNIELTAPARAAMAAWSAANQKGAHGEHRYRAEDFGLRDGELAEAFGAYTDRFEIG